MPSISPSFTASIASTAIPTAAAPQFQPLQSSHIPVYQFKFTHQQNGNDTSKILNVDRFPSISPIKRISPENHSFVPASSITSPSTSTTTTESTMPIESDYGNRSMTSPINQRQQYASTFTPNYAQRSQIDELRRQQSLDATELRTHRMRNIVDEYGTIRHQLIPFDPMPSSIDQTDDVPPPFNVNAEMDARLERLNQLYNAKMSLHAQQQPPDDFDEPPIENVLLKRDAVYGKFGKKYQSEISNLNF